ncbi:hypothetical protein T484DRAFT_1755758 [Baffinella frigidus]|nr:hypothetical protein T484DRAFT_1755758 [Cryptophyta sp. CCMP2293]
MRYLAYGKETCPTTDKQHYQGFAYLFKAQCFSAWKKLFPGCHLEQMKGNFRDNEVYCSKETELTEFGEKPNDNGIKTTVLEVKRRLDEGNGTMDIAEDPECFNTVRQSCHFSQQYEQHARSKKARTDRTMPQVYIRYGDTGTGKTRWLDEQYRTGRLAFYAQQQRTVV